MCGIAGFSGAGDHTTIAEMVATLKHRGPDDTGIFLHNHTALAQARLAIIDLSPGGHQPMANADGTVHITFNGEIYNYRELKKEFLQNHSYPFRSESDTEVLLALYQVYGLKMFEKLNGMFALALYDQSKDLLILARDRFGKKPLYYGIFDHTLIFGSEPKAVLQHPHARRELDLRSLSLYLQYEYVPTPYSIYQGISKLEPASYALWQGGTLTQYRFWSFQKNASTLTFPEAVDTLGKHLERSTKLRLVSDVPVGIFLSGGIDSSTVAYYAQAVSKQKIKTFSIGFKEASFDESSYARQVATHLGTEHYEHMLSANESLDLIPTIAKLLDEPLADPSLLPTYLLSRFTRSKVTVALGGDGGDELLAGYDTFQALQLSLLYQRIPRFIRSLGEPLVNLFPVGEKNMSFGFRARRMIDGMRTPVPYRNQRWLSSFTLEAQHALLSSNIRPRTNAYDVIDERLRDDPTTDPLNQLSYTYLTTYMLDDILAKVDRASMYNSLEVRAPFLDHQLAEFALALPSNYKIHGMTMKYILKKLMEDKLPRDVVYRPKKGFGIPLTRWLKNELKPLMDELLSKERLARQGLFNYDLIARLRAEHDRGQQDNRKELWTLMVFQMWYDTWYK